MPCQFAIVPLATLFVSQEITGEVRFRLGCSSLDLGDNNMIFPCPSILNELALPNLFRLGLASNLFASIDGGYHKRTKGSAAVSPRQLPAVIDLTGSDKEAIEILSFKRKVRRHLSDPGE